MFSSYLTVIYCNIKTDSDVQSNIVQLPVAYFPQIFDNTALIQRFQLLQYDHGWPVQSIHISQKIMCRLFRFLFYIRCHRGDDQRRAVMIPSIILKNQYGPYSAKLRAYHRIKISKINIAPPIFPIITDMSSPLFMFLLIYVLLPIRSQPPEAGKSSGDSLLCCLIGIEPLRLHYGRAASYGSIIIPCAFHRHIRCNRIFQNG